MACQTDVSPAAATIFALLGRIRFVAWYVKVGVLSNSSEKIIPAIIPEKLVTGPVLPVTLNELPSTPIGKVAAQTISAPFAQYVEPAVIVCVAPDDMVMEP